MINPYEILGVSENATADEIKSAYRQRAKECHPDLHPDDPGAQDKMNQVNEAYDILNDPEKLNMWKAQKEQEEYSRRYGSYQQTSNPYGPYSGGGNPYQQYGQPYQGQYQNQQPGGFKFTFFGPFGYYSSDRGFNSYFGGNQNNQAPYGSKENPYGSGKRRTVSPIARIARTLIRLFIAVTAIRFFMRLLLFMGGGFLYHMH